MNKSPTIQGKNVVLRKPKESDTLDRYNCGRSEELVRMYGGDTRNLKPLTMEDAKKFVDSVLSHELDWCIEFNGRCIGQARLTVNGEDCRARYAIGIFDTSELGKGLGTEVTQLMLKYAFEELKLHRVDLRVLEYNHRAIACYEKCGFIKEGVEREGALIEDKFETDVFMSILDREYEAKRGNFLFDVVSHSDA
ncbi:MAG: GNAT family N-acetyltransferase [Bacilli bacterium]